MGRENGAWIAWRCDFAPSPNPIWGCSTVSPRNLRCRNRSSGSGSHRRAATGSAGSKMDCSGRAPIASPLSPSRTMPSLAGLIRARPSGPVAEPGDRGTYRARNAWAGAGAASQRLLVEYLFSTTSAFRVWAATEVENIAEQRALERSGFSQEGRLRGTHFRDGKWRHSFVYGIVARRRQRFPRAGSRRAVAGLFRNLSGCSPGY